MDPEEVNLLVLNLFHSFSKQYHLPYILLLVLCPSKNIWNIINPHLSEPG